MSVRDQVLTLLDKVPSYKMGYVIGYLQGLTADEDMDDEFCEQLYQNYLNDPDPEKDQAVPLEELTKELGIKI